uniref:Coiled-coil domain-containing protein 130 n=1 Tax=Globisporangium ultimum (strain ATCC 200006 / CBS 805.95 / DAOM BR144) TaxID=431595 RepID=K3X4L3_GLOUD
MSSLSAARADNYYYPRAWRPEHGSINQFHKSHPLGARAKDVAHGVLVVRFEMPFNVWCAHCKTHIGRGVRFNAKKKKCGMYFSTIRYEFALTCANCKGAMVIQTDPENRGYKLVSGVTQQTQGPDAHYSQHDDSSAHAPIEDTEPLNDPQVSMQLATDPFFRLEHDKEDQRVAAKRARGLDALLELKDAHDKDNYSSNAALRAAFRSQKKQIQQRADEADKLGLSIPLVDVHDDDVLAAKAVVYKNIPGKRRASAASSSRHTSTARKLDYKATARTHSKVSTSSGKGAKTDSFQHFGDAMGSHLHRLKMAKKSAAAAETSRSKKQLERSSHGSSLAERARKLLRR